MSPPGVVPGPALPAEPLPLPARPAAPVPLPAAPRVRGTPLPVPATPAMPALGPVTCMVTLAGAMPCSAATPVEPAEPASGNQRPTGGAEPKATDECSVAGLQPGAARPPASHTMQSKTALFRIESNTIPGARNNHAEAVMRAAVWSERLLCIAVSDWSRVICDPVWVGREIVSEAATEVGPFRRPYSCRGCCRFAVRCSPRSCGR
jgi:hypothetical protein